MKVKFFKLSLFIFIISSCFYCCTNAHPEDGYKSYIGVHGKIIYENDPILQYTHKTIKNPIIDGINLEIPNILKNSKLAEYGFVNVTAPPFLADPTGQKDSTEAIQQAINVARDSQMVCYFPLGTYKVSDTIFCEQGFYMRNNRKVWGSPYFFCSLMGEKTDPTKRPIIFLAPNSKGFNNPEKPKDVIRFWTRGPVNFKLEAPNWAFNQKFSNIDIKIGEGNPGAVAIELQGAVGSGITDSFIDVTHGLIGVLGGSGAGGCHANITILGGKIGMNLEKTQPSPILIGITLTEQSETALIYGGSQSLSAIGLKIITKTKGPVIKVQPKVHDFFNGPISLVDSEIIFENDYKESTAISTNRAAYLNNVYIKNVSYIVSNPEGKECGNPEGWITIKEYAYKYKPDLWEGLQYEHPIYINGEKISKNITEYEQNKIPPYDLVSKHIWSDDFPSWDSKKAVNVKSAPYYAKGDAYSDDTNALQKAIDENEIVFIPKGYYRVKKTIKLKPNTKLVGIDPYFSIIIIKEEENYFTNPNKTKPIIETSDIKNADTVLYNIGIFVPYEVPGAHALNWQCGGFSILRNTKPMLESFEGNAVPVNCKKIRKMPLTVIKGNGGGRWFNQSAAFRICSSDYRHILIDEIRGPLNMYAFLSQYCVSDAACEINNSSNVNIFGVKGEGTVPILWIRNSNNIRIFGYGSNAAPLGDNSLFKFENVFNFLIVNAIDRPRFGNNLEDKSIPGPGPGRHPSEWSIITEITKDGKVVKTKPFERPVLYKRGEPK